MPSVKENREKWGSAYGWPEDGDEWSRPWGGAEMQWHWMVKPRIRSYLPAARIVEIAPGYGRWTQFLILEAERLWAADILESCIIACNKRFSRFAHASFFLNDGASLSCVADGEADFIFSFDSLVHAEADTIEAYLREIGRKLSKDGVAFMHHSNLGEYPVQAWLSGIPKLRAGLRWLGLLEKRCHWRGKSVTAAKVEEIARGHGLQCISQELVNWSTRRALIDCFTTLVRPDSKWARENRVVRNHRFMLEAEGIRRLASLYGS